MKEIRLVKSVLIFPLINELIAEDRHVRITVTGMSMYPFLRENIDSVELSSCCFNDIRRGDIAMILRDSNEYVMHRVYKKEKTSFYIVGDAQRWIEGPLQEKQLIAKITAVWRSDKRIECTSFLWKLLSWLWLFLLPLRPLFIRGYSKIYELTHRLMKSNF